MICSILTAKYTNFPIDPQKLANKIINEIKDKYKTYPNGNLSTECRYLSLEEFLTSHEAKGFHWTVHKTTSKLDIF